MIANHHRVIVPLLAALFTNVTYALDVNSELDTEAIACNHKESWMQEAKKDIPDSSGYSIVAKTFEAQQRRGTASLVYDLWVGLEKTVEGKQQKISAICLPGILRQNDFILRNKNYGMDGVEIDTGRYYLHDGTRAFGIRLNLSKRVTGGNISESQQVLYLFEQKDDELVPVIRNLMVKLDQSLSNGDCEGTGLYKLERQLILLNNEQTGHRDIQVKETESSGVFKLATSEEQKNGTYCSAILEKYKTSRWVLSFDGHQYIVPNALQPQLNISDRRPARRSE